MSEITKADDVYAAIEEASRLLDVDCSRDEVWPVLTAYEDAFTEAVIVLSIATGSDAGELDYSITIPKGGADPYEVALEKGFTAPTDHPVGVLLSDIRDRFPLGGYAIDVGVGGGFKKTYTFFPLEDLPGVPGLSEVPSMPRSLAGNAGYLAEHGLVGGVTGIGIDYQHNTANIYFGKLPAERLEPQAIRSLIVGLGLPEPSEQLLEFARSAFAIYITLNWDSPKIERICFAVITSDPMGIPAQLDPEIARFATIAPYAFADEGDRVLVYGITAAPTGEYYKLGSYYQMAQQTRKLLMAFTAFKGEKAYS
jgi:hypothetical protein